MSLTKFEPKRFLFTQNSASDTWTVNHDFGEYPIVDVFVDFEGEQQRIIPAGIVHTNLNSTVIEFSVPFSGFAVLS